MKDNPLIVSLLIGLIVVLLIGGVSLSFGLTKAQDAYKKEVAKNISSEKTIEDMKQEKSDLEDGLGRLNVQIEDLSTQIRELKEENLKLETLKDRIEENLKEELMKQKLNGK